MDRHPTQPHIVATGGQDGTLYLWDMRQEKYPITLLEAHSSNSKKFITDLTILLMRVYFPGVLVTAYVHHVKLINKTFVYCIYTVFVS